VIIDSGSRNHVNNSPLYCSVVQRACGCLNRRDLPALEAHGGNGVGVGTGPAPASGFLRGYKLREVEAAYGKANRRLSRSIASTSPHTRQML